MGARLGKHAGGGRRVAVEERYCKPSGTFTNLRNIDGNRLRQLIQHGKLSPCYPGVEDPAPGDASMEECPICFLHYPALNRSKCCQKGLCTECFLQVKAPPNQQVACPFCKELGYAVVFRGKKSAEELQRELLEDQRVIEARIRARQAEQAASDRSRAAGTGSHSRTPSSSTVPVPGAVATSSPAAAGCDATSSPTPPSTPLTALPMLSPGGTFRVSSSGAGSGSGVDERDEARRRAAFLTSSGGGGGGGVAEADARRLGRLADYLPPALLARTRASDIDLEDLMLMEAIWRSLQTAPEGSLPPAAAPAGAAAPGAAPAAGARHSGSESEGEEEEEEEEDFDGDATTEDGDDDEAAASTADASPNAPALSEADMQRAMSLPREPGMPDADVPRGPLSRRASDIGGPRPQLRRRSAAARADSELEQLRNWGSYATPAAAHAAEEEMMAIAMRLSLAESQPQPTPEADAAAAADAAPPAAEPDPDAGAAVSEPDTDASLVAALVATAVTAAVDAVDAPPAPAA